MGIKIRDPPSPLKKGGLELGSKLLFIKGEFGGTEN
jgi:hypothetical protein